VVGNFARSRQKGKKNRKPAKGAERTVTIDADSVNAEARFANDSMLEARGWTLMFVL